MAFRAQEESIKGRESAVERFITKYLTQEKRAQSEQALHRLIDEWGPVVSAYPAWHPIVTSVQGYTREKFSHPHTRPSEKTGYQGLDHTILLKNAFITCPYGGAETILDSVEQLEDTSFAKIRAEALDFELYHRDATPVLVKCIWSHPMETDGTIPKRLAVPLMLEYEVPMWRWSEVAETWATMRSYILGSPHGSRSSLFVNQETGQTLKSLYKTLIETGMFGPIYQESAKKK